MFGSRKIDENDELKMKRIYEVHKNAMFYEAMQILKDRNLAEDAVQQTFLKIIGKLDRIEEENIPMTRSFLNIVCRNIAIDMYNSGKIETASADCIYLVDFLDSKENDEPIEMLINKENLDKLKSKIAELPDIYRDVISLEFLHHYSKREISEMFNIPYDTIKKRSIRGRKILREVLRKEEMKNEE